ncbi:MAG: hypothetical protein CNLJKLNK_00509 [Holosporales bacterium]
MKKYLPSQILPHKSPMILVDDYLTFDEQSICARVTIRESSPFFETNGVASYVGVEYMAQAIGMWRGLLGKLKNKEPKVGYLVSCRKLTTSKEYFNLGETVLIHCFLKSQVDQMASFACHITLNEEVVSQCLINVYQPEE